MESARISVVIPTFRRPQLLHKCLDALRKQIAPDITFEVIVVSDGPDPDTDLLVNAMACDALQNFRFIPLPHKKGPAAARNFGWRRATGELVIFTDDDTLPDPTFVHSYWRAYQRRQRDEVVFAGKVIVPVPARPTDYEKNVAHLSTAEFVTANCACSRAALEKVNGFDEDFPAAWREDSDLQFRFLENNMEINQVPEAIVSHPARPARWGVSLREQQKSMFNALLFKKHPTLYRERIAGGPVWNYYAMIAATILALVAVIFHWPVTALHAFIAWVMLVAEFVSRRLRGTNPSFSHRSEMLVTSIFIPYLSVYWTIRGAIRYQVLFF